jgi:hypothetical protein
VLELHQQIHHPVAATRRISEGAISYFVNIGPAQGPYLDRDVPGLIDVLLEPKDAMPIGVAFSLGPNADGVPLWKLNIDGGWVPGRYVVVDREFRPAECGGRQAATPSPSDRSGNRCMARYFATGGPARGPYLDQDATATIGVLRAPDKLMPIGVAMPIGPDGAGVARWRLTVHGAVVPGLWVVIDREFRPAQ